MEQHNYNKQNTLNSLISEYEAMSQKGTVGFYEETVFSQLIDYYENESAIDIALEVVEQALNQHLFSTSLYCRKAALLALQKQEAAAFSALKQAENLSPSDYEVKLMKAEVYGLFGDFTLALSIIKELKVACHINNTNQLAAIFFSEGVIYEKMQQYDSMFVAWKQTLKFNPTHKEVLDKIWLCVEMSRKFDESIELCNQVIDHDPYCAKAWYNLGHAQTYFGDYQAAIEAYEYAFIIDKEFEWAYRHCAELCMEIKNYAKALDCYEEALPYVLPDGDLLFKIGQCYQFIGKIEFAQEFYRRSIQLDEINDEVYFHLGACSATQNNWKKAIFYYKKAIEIEEEREEYFAALAQAYAKLGNQRKAFQYFDRAIELAPEQATYWVQFATFLLNRGDYTTALNLLDDADQYSVGAELLYAKSACLFKLGKEKEAMNVLADALTEDFDMHPLLFDFLPHLALDRKIQAILDFYKYEQF